jgi:hypothetical protein
MIGVLLRVFVEMLKLYLSCPVKGFQLKANAPLLPKLPLAVERSPSARAANNSLGFNNAAPATSAPAVFKKLRLSLMGNVC